MFLKILRKFRGQFYFVEIMRKYPNLDTENLWGGNSSGPPGKYGEQNVAKAFIVFKFSSSEALLYHGYVWLSYVFLVCVPVRHLG